MCCPDESFFQTKKIAMATLTKLQKVSCLNPNTGGSINIEKSTYELFSKAVFQTLKMEGSITFTQLVEGIKACLQKQKTTFSGSVEWYAVTVKNDLHAKGVIEVFSERGKKLHRLKK
jgi:hypothetical protein